MVPGPHLSNDIHECRLAPVLLDRAMAYSRRCITTALCWTLLPGCSLKVEGDETGAGATAASESGSDGGQSSTPQPSGTEASGVAVTEASDAGDSEVDPGDTSASGTGFLTTQGTTNADTDTEGGMTDGDPDTDTDTGGEPLPAICSEKQPGVSAAFEFSGWDALDDQAIPCTVDALAIEALMVVTSMTCITGNGPQAVVLKTAEAVEGAPTWGPGDAVLYYAESNSDIGFDEVWRRFSLRLAADDSLLAVGIDRDTMHAEWIAPIVMERSYPCGAAVDEDGFERPFQLDFELAGQTLSLTPYHRGVLTFDAIHSYAIDVERAATNVCCHFEGGHWQHVLIRRVATP